VSDYQTATTDGALSTAAFIAGGALLAGGIALYFTAPAPLSPPDAPSRPQAALSIAPGVLSLRGTF
jgi:hypothetical protein